MDENKKAIIFVDGTREYPVLDVVRYSVNNEDDSDMDDKIARRTSEIVYRKSVHVGVAVDTPRGLLVPVIRDVDRKGIFELASELAKASEKARGGKLSLGEMQGGGFTITNLGGIGGTHFTPIVNAPEPVLVSGWLKVPPPGFHVSAAVALGTSIVPPLLLSIQSVRVIVSAPVPV